MELNNVKLYILKSGLKNRFLAQELGCHETEISQWIAGRRKPSHERLKKLSKLLKCNMSDLIPYITYSRKVVYKGE